LPSFDDLNLAHLPTPVNQKNAKLTKFIFGSGSAVENINEIKHLKSTHKMGEIFVSAKSLISLMLHSQTHKIRHFSQKV